MTRLTTFPLVSIASCTFMLVAIDIYHGSQPEARIMYAMITGMGFIGGGAIFKGDSTVKGTAISLWNTATIGSSVYW